MAVDEGVIGELHAVEGFRLGTVSAGIKKPGRKDLVLMEICEGASVAGVYTNNAFRAAPVQVARRHAAAMAPRYFLVNTGNANAGTGEPGLRAALDCCAALAGHAAVPLERVLPFSTGVIGQPLPADRIIAALPAALDAVRADGWLEAAEGIMTTDTRPKAASRRLALASGSINLTGIAKGAGMIRPDMATMLAFVATDAQVDGDQLQALLNRTVDKSFNRITVDGDTSTNDCCMLAATGRGGGRLAGGGGDFERFRDALDSLCLELAQAIVRDAEGATKFVGIHVEQAASPAEALQVAYTVAQSPLVKTALFASDPNWGRILAAVGRDIRIRLGRGEHAEQVWTCDFSYDYVEINAEYRT